MTKCVICGQDLMDRIAIIFKCCSYCDDIRVRELKHHYNVDRSGRGLKELNIPHCLRAEESGINERRKHEK